MGIEVAVAAGASYAGLCQAVVSPPAVDPDFENIIFWKRRRPGIPTVIISRFTFCNVMFRVCHNVNMRNILICKRELDHQLTKLESLMKSLMSSIA